MTDSPIPPFRKEKFRIRQNEVTREGFLRVNVFFDYMQEIAACHANEIGVGFRTLCENGMMWVLSRLKLQIIRTPRIGETIEIMTYPSGFERLFATREFSFIDENGMEIAVASSCWLLLDSAKFRPLKPSVSLPAELPDNSMRKRNFIGLDKLGRETVSDPMEFPVLESMIDVNRHMNNAHYVTHVFDWLSKKTSSVPELSEIQVNFIASTAPGAVLTALGTVEENKFYVECLQGEELHFQAAGLLKT